MPGGDGFKHRAPTPAPVLRGSVCKSHAPPPQSAHRAHSSVRQRLPHPHTEMRSCPGGSTQKPESPAARGPCPPTLTPRLRGPSTPSHSMGSGWGCGPGTWCRGHPGPALVQLQRWLPFEVGPVQARAREQGAEGRVAARDLVADHCGRQGPQRSRPQPWEGPGGGLAPQEEGPWRERCLALPRWGAAGGQGRPLGNSWAISVSRSPDLSPGSGLV